MKTWAVQDAKAHFSELLEVCLIDGPQVVTRRGIETVVVVPIHELKRLNEAARPSLKALLLGDNAKDLLEISARGSARRRQIPKEFE